MLFIIILINPPSMSVNCHPDMDMDMLMLRADLIISSIGDPDRETLVICDKSVNTWCIVDDVVESWFMFDVVQFVPGGTWAFNYYY